MAFRFLSAVPDEVKIIIYELVVAGLNGYIIYGISRTCNEIEAVLRELRKAPILTLGEDLVQAVQSTENETIPCAAIRGKVKEYDGVIDASPNGVPSVIRISDNREILSKYGWDGFRYQFRGSVYETKEFRPFCLTKISDNPIGILTPDIPLSVNKSEVGDSSTNNNFFSSSIGEKKCWDNPVLIINDIIVPDTTELLQTFPTYFDRNETQSSWLGSAFDYVFGIATLVETQRTERLLPVNEIITAIGRVTKTGAKEYTLTAPCVPNSLYLLTTRPIEDIIDEYSGRTTGLGAVVGLLTVGGIWIIFDAVKRLINLFAVYREDIDRFVRLRNRELPGDEDEINDAQLCIVCLVGPREVVPLPCRHFCVCTACVRQLGGRCPVCRQRFHDVIRIYVS